MTNELWEYVVSRVGAVLNFGIEKKEEIKKSRMAKFIAAIPFLAGCNKALETSFSHLAIYLLSFDESSKDIYFHKPEDDDDIYSRLFPVSSFSGGDKIVIQCCMDLLALCMLSNYKKDLEEDKAIGKYNPLNFEKWNYNTMASNLITNIDNSNNKEIKLIYTKEDALKGFWRD